ncbi:hypothetical protein ACRRTK_006026 [Alexandromys fortis]
MEEKAPGPVKMNEVIVLSEQSSHRTQIRGSHAGSKESSFSRVVQKTKDSRFKINNNKREKEKKTNYFLRTFLLRAVAADSSFRPAGREKRNRRVGRAERPDCGEGSVSGERSGVRAESYRSAPPEPAVKSVSNALVKVLFDDVGGRTVSSSPHSTAPFTVRIFQEDFRASTGAKEHHLGVCSCPQVHCQVPPPTMDASVVYADLNLARTQEPKHASPPAPPPAKVEEECKKMNIEKDNEALLKLYCLNPKSRRLEKTLSVDTDSTEDAFRAMGMAAVEYLLETKDGERKCAFHTEAAFYICQCPRWHQLALKLGCAGLILLVLTVIGLGVLECTFHFLPVFYLPLLQKTPVGKGVQENKMKTTVGKCNVNVSESSTKATESPVQLTCPKDWLPHREKCIQIFQEKGVWKEGLSNCTRKGATLLLIHDQEELRFVKNSIKESGHQFWIGLNYTLPDKHWRWINGSILSSDMSSGVVIDFSRCTEDLAVSAALTSELGLSGRKTEVETKEEEFLFSCQKALVHKGWPCCKEGQIRQKHSLTQGPLVTELRVIYCLTLRIPRISDLTRMQGWTVHPMPFGGIMERASESVKGLLAETREAVKLSHGNLEHPSAWSIHLADRLHTNKTKLSKGYDKWTNLGVCSCPQVHCQIPPPTMDASVVYADLNLARTQEPKQASLPAPPPELNFSLKRVGLSHCFEEEKQVYVYVSVKYCGSLPAAENHNSGKLHYLSPYSPAHCPQKVASRPLHACWSLTQNVVLINNLLAYCCVLQLPMPTLASVGSETQLCWVDPSCPDCDWSRCLRMYISLSSYVFYLPLLQNTPVGKGVQENKTKATVEKCNVNVSESSTKATESPVQLKCPNDWLPHREKCIQFSQENGVWKEGLSNCTRKGATLLLIQDQEELSKESLKSASEVEQESKREDTRARNGQPAENVPSQVDKKAVSEDSKIIFSLRSPALAGDPTASPYAPLLLPHLSFDNNNRP